MSSPPRVGLLWRAEWDTPDPNVPIPESCKLRGVFAAFSDLGVEARPVIYADSGVEAVRAELLGLDGVLVWVNPIQDGLDRSKLDPLLREAADAGVWVSAHPDVIQRMATKRVLYDTREMSWGSDTRLYLSADELRDGLVLRLPDRVPRVLKQQWGMGGQGVWRVEQASPGKDPTISVRQALRDAPVELMHLSEFVARCEPYFDGDGLMVEQPYQERIGDGMIRVYLTHQTVVGFAHQHPSGLRPPEAGPPPPGKHFERPDVERFQPLRQTVEAEWVPQMQRLLDLGTDALPVIWDVDFLFGPKTRTGEDGYVLCEINASSTFAFPEFAMATVARAAIERISVNRPRSETAP